MSIDITARVHVDREPAVVAAYMTDPGNDPEWIGGLRILAPLVRRNVQRDLGRLRDALEA
jgi:hypothetical protein